MKTVQTTEKVQQRRTEPIRGFQKAMVKTMTEALVNIYVFIHELPTNLINQDTHKNIHLKKCLAEIK